MVTRKQIQAARQNVKKAQSAAKSRRTIANLPQSTRSELGKQAARGARRGGQAGHRLEERNREQLYEQAKEMASQVARKMGKWGPDRRDPQGALSKTRLYC